MTNPYLDLLSSEDEKAASAAPAPKGNPYLATLQAVADDEETRLKQRINEAARANPEQAAKAAQLGKKMEIPVDAVARNLMDVQLQDAVNTYDKKLQTSPKLLRAVRDVPNFMNQVHDDLDNASLLEQAVTAIGTGAREIVSGVPSMSAGFYGVVENAVKLVAPLGDPLAGTILPENPLRRVAAGIGEWRKSQQKLAADVAGPLPPDAGLLRLGVRSGLQSVGSSLPGLVMTVITKDPRYALASGGVTEGGQAAAKGLDTGMAPFNAALYGASNASVEIATEAIPVGRLLKDLGGQAGIARVLRNQVIAEVPGEQVATILQDLNEWAVINPDKPFKSYVEERPAAAVQTLIATIIGTGIQTGALQLAERSMRAASKAQEAHEGFEKLQEVLNVATGSKLLKRNPEALREFIQQMGDEEGISEVYVDAQTLMQTLQQAGVTDEQFAGVLPTTAGQMVEALNTGGTVTLPIGDLATKLTGLGLDKTLLQHIRMEPDSLNHEEAQAATSEAQTLLQQEAQRVLAEATDIQATMESAERVRETVLNQLAVGKRFRPEVNTAYATFIRDFYTATSGRLGITPEEMYAKYPLRVVAESPVQGESVLNREPKALPAGVAIEETATGFIAKDATGKQIGRLEDTLKRGQAQQINEPATVDIVKVDDAYRGKGVGAALYAAFNEKHQGRIAPSGKTTADAWHVWKRDFPEKVVEFVQQEAARILDGADRGVVIGNITDPEIAQQVLDAAGPEVREPVLQQETQGAVNAQRTEQLAASPSDAAAAEQQFERDIAAYGGETPPGEFSQQGRIRGSIGVLADAPIPNLGADQPLANLPATVKVNGKDVTFGPFAPAREAAARYAERAGLPYNPPVTYAKVDAKRAKLIADAFEAMPHDPADPAVKASYDAMIRETVAQWQAIKETGLVVEFITGDDPYGNPRNAILDVVENNHLWVYPTSAGFGGTESAGVDISGNPLLAVVPGEEISGRPVQANDIFRIVHDYFGHIKEGVGFRAEGEENAWRSHWAMYSPLARQAMTTETRGQNSWVNFGPFTEFNKTASGADTQYAPQKIGLLPAWVVEEGATDTGGVLLQTSPAPTVGIHFSKQPRKALDGRYYGSGLKGLEGERLRESTDQRIKERVYVYLDEGNGVRPESGVGGFAHEVPLPALYDAKADPLKLWKGGDLNATESRILDAGFGGYFIRNAFNNQGAAVVLGPQSRGIAVAEIAVPGYVAPAPAAPAVYKRGLMSAELNLLNIAEIQAVAPSASVKAGTFQVNEADLPAAQAAAAAQGVNLPSMVLTQPRGTAAAPGGPRATFNPKTLTINLLQTADLSSFLHESGHFFLEVMADIASQPNAPADVAADMETVLKWFGVTDLFEWNTRTLDQKRPFHEKFAESFEQYLFEGKAPSAELQPIFSKFRSWMMTVYKSIKEIFQQSGGGLSNEVREVFDRLLATQDQIAEKQRLAGYTMVYQSAEQAGMTPEEWAEYQKQDETATAEAMDALQTRTLRDLRWTINARSKELKRLQGEVDDQRKAMRYEVEAEVIALPIYRAWNFLTGRGEKTAAQTETQSEYQKEFTDWKQKREEMIVEERKKAASAMWEASAESKAPAPEGRSKGLVKGQFMARAKKDIDLVIGRTALDWDRANPAPTRPSIDSNVLRNGAQIFGKLGAEALKTIGVPEPILAHVRNLRMTAADGLHPNMVAEIFGFASGDDLVRQLAAAFTPEETIDGLTDARLLETYGDTVTEAGMKRAAEESILNEARARFMATGLKAISQAQTPTKVLLKAAKMFAQNLVARRKIMDLKPSVFTGAGARAAKRLAEATVASDTQAAISAQRDQLLNHYAAKYTTETQAEVAKALEYLRKFDKEATRKTIPLDYIEQIDSMLERFDLRSTTTLRAIEKRKSLAAWVAEQEEMGLSPVIPEGLLEEARSTSYKELTVEEFRGVVDSVKNIEHLGRLKGKLLKAKDKREFALIVGEIEQSIRDNATKSREVRVNAPTAKDRAADFARGFFSSHRKLGSLVRQLDGFKDGGPFWQVFTRTMNEAGDQEAVLRAKATEELAKIFTPFLKNNKLSEMAEVPSIRKALSLETRLAVALNSGNSANKQRVMDGDKWSEAQLNDVLSTLTPEQLKFVQAVWDNIDKYWPDIKAKEERVSGVAPEKVAAEPLLVKAKGGEMVQLAGGYYPIKYDPDRSSRAEADTAAELTKQMLMGQYTRATTRRNHTQARAETVNRAVRKDLGVVFQHVDQVIHDLAWHEWLIDANRLVRSNPIETAIRETVGPEVLREFKKAIEDIAAGDVPAQSEFERGINHIRQGATIVGLGWNVMTSLMQPLGLTQSMVRIGPRWVGKGLARWVGDAVRMEKGVSDVYEKSSFMKLRAQTINREINEIRNKVQGAKLTALEETYFYLIQKMQIVADMPTWLGQYEKTYATSGIADPAALEAEAIAQADQAVRDAQGSGMTGDLARIQRGTALQKLFTSFYSYFSTTYNLTAERYNMTSFKNPLQVGRFAVDMLLLYVLPSVLVTLMKEALTGKDDDEDKLLEKVARDQLNYLLGSMVGLREAGAAINGFTGYQGPAGTRFFSELAKLGKQVEQGEVDKALLKAISNTGGMLFHFPAGQVNRTVEGFLALKEGETENPLALLFGPPR